MINILGNAIIFARFCAVLSAFCLLISASSNIGMIFAFGLFLLLEEAFMFLGNGY